MKDNRLLKWWQSTLLLFFTSGVATSNGLKSVIAFLFVNGKKLFKPKFMLLGIILPLTVLSGIRQCQYHIFEVPQDKVTEKLGMIRAKKATEKEKQLEAERMEWVSTHDMQRAGDSKLLKLIDKSTPRIPTIVENFWGESILLHRDHALEDVLCTRPIFVHYRSWWCIAMLGGLLIVFVLVVWRGRR